MSSVSVTNPTDGDIFTASDSYRTKLDNKVDSFVGETIDRYETVLKSLDTDLAAVRDLIANRQALGLPVPASWLHRQSRYIDLIDQTYATVDNYSKILKEDVRRGATDTFNQAQEDALGLIDRQLPGYEENIKPFNRLNKNAAEQYMGSTYSERTSPLPGVFRSMGPEAGDTLDREILNGISQGLHPNDVVRNASAVMTASQLSRAATIARTEMYRSYREANRRVFAQNDDIVDKWIWHAHIGEYTCAACYASHGEEFDVKEPMASHPNCRCTQIPKTKSWEDLGIDMPDSAEMQYGREGQWVNGQWVTSRTGRRKRTGEERFAELTDLEQRKILGPKKYAAYKAGDIQLRDTIVTRKNGRWGKTRSVGSLDQALRNAEARRFNEAMEQSRKQVLQARVDALKVDDDAPEWVRDIQKIKRDSIAKHGRMTEEATRDVGKIIRGQMEADLPADYATIGPRITAVRKDYTKAEKSLTSFEKKHDLTFKDINNYNPDGTPLNPSYRPLSPTVMKDWRKKTDLKNGLSKEMNDLQEKLYVSKPLSPAQAKRIKEIKEENDRLIQKMNTTFAPSERHAIRKELETLRKENQAIRGTQYFDLAGPTKKKIAAIRPVGRNGLKHKGTVSDAEVEKAFEEALEQYPTDWVEKSVNADPVLLSREGRGYLLRTGQGTKIVTSGTTYERRVETMVHESGHRFEDTVPGIREAEKEFYERRTEGGKLISMNAATKSTGYARWEKTVPDDFYNPYVGKDYGGRYYEVVSMGFEQMLTPNALQRAHLTERDYARTILEDPDYMDFILGILGGM